jgi:simple sugar transport system substrate-binding protein/ribose transport system substrate-binding protein
MYYLPKRGTLILAAVSTATAIGLCACASSSPAGSSPTSPASTTSASTSPPAETGPLAGFKLASYIHDDVASGKKLRFVYITNDLSSSYTSAQRVGVQKAASQLGVDAELQGPPTGAAQDQVSLIQTLIAQHNVDGIVVAAVNVDSLKPVIQQAFDSGIPLVSAFTDQPDSKQLAFVGEDNEKFGEYLGAKLGAALHGKSGKVVIVSVDTAAGWSTERVSGLKKSLSAADPSLTLVGPINTGIEPGQMFNAIQSAMQANPGAIAIASVDCCSIDGAAKWAESSGNGNGKVIVIGTDALKQTLNYITSGTVAFSVSQDPVGQVFTAISQLKQFITNDTPPKTTIMPPILVDKANASSVTPEG